MLTLAKYLQKKQVKYILYTHDSGELNVELLKFLSTTIPDSWIVVLSNDRQLDRYKHKQYFEVIYGDISSYKAIIKYDAIFIPRTKRQDLTKSIARYVISLVPFRSTTEKDTLEFYIPSEYITWLPLSIQTFLTKYSVFADHSIKFILGIK